MKKVFSILLVVAMLACFMIPNVLADEAAVATASVYGTHVSGKTGDTVTVSVGIGNNSGFKSGKVTLSYDASALKLVSVSRGLFSNGSQNLSDGVVVINHAGSEPVLGNGTLFSVTFEILAACGTTSNVGVTVNSLYAPDNTPVSVGSSGGSVAVDHNYEVVNTVASTCAVAGYTEHKCSICGDTYQEALPLAEHTPKAAVIENEVAATCTTDGSYDEVVYCSVCGEELSRKTVTVKGGHKWADLDTWSYDEKTHWHECTVCGARCEHEDDHQTVEEGAVRVAYAGASATKDGYATYECFCGYQWTITIPADPNLDPDIPPTGDITDTITAGTAAILITMMGAVALVVKRKTV